MIQLWMYGTPVVYPLSDTPAKWRWLVELNPASFDLELFRIALLGKGTITVSLAVSSLVLTLLLGVSGLALFTRAERTFVDIA